MQLAEMMERHRGYGRSLIVTDGVFSMDGDMVPLVELVALKRKHDALLMVDDAHGSGVLGRQGRGSADLLGVADGVDIMMGTFGKALGSFGAYAAVSAELRELLLNKSRSFIFSTSLPPAVLAASLAAVELVQSPEGDLLREQLHGNAAFFRKCLKEMGFEIPEGSTQIMPVITGTSDVTMRFSEALLEEGIFAQGIRPPTVPAGSCRIRFTIMATHRIDDLKNAVEIIGKVGTRLGVV
jgi:7-keto-8-aminopelargonate synthetase-like enzyme